MKMKLLNFVPALIKHTRMNESKSLGSLENYKQVCQSKVETKLKEDTVKLCLSIKATYKATVNNIGVLLKNKRSTRQYACTELVHPAENEVTAEQDFHQLILYLVVICNLAPFGDKSIFFKCLPKIGDQ